MKSTITAIHRLCRERLPAGFILFSIDENHANTPHIVSANPDGQAVPAKQMPLMCGKPSEHAGDHEASVRWPS